MVERDGIHDSLAAIKTALRVLIAVNTRKSPNPGDVERLRSYAPDAAHLAADELACEVVQRMTEARARVLAATKRRQ
jgi:hypothetical protein